MGAGDGRARRGRAAARGGLSSSSGAWDWRWRCAVFFALAGRAHHRPDDHGARGAGGGAGVPALDGRGAADRASAPWMLDGIFIGATGTRAMRNTMVVSVAVYVGRACGAGAGLRQSRALGRADGAERGAGGDAGSALPGARGAGRLTPQRGPASPPAQPPRIDSERRSGGIGATASRRVRCRPPRRRWRSRRARAARRGPGRCAATSRSPRRPSRCRAAPPRRRRGSWHRPARPSRRRRRRSAAAGPRSACDSRASTRVERSKSGAPERPPASAAWRLVQPVADSVVLVATIAAMPAPRRHSAMSARSPSSRSGAILRKTGSGRAAPRGPSRPPAAPPAPPAPAGRAAARCWARRR